MSSPLIYGLNLYTKNARGLTLSSELPRSLDRKIKFARKAFTRFVALQTYAIEGNQLLDRLQKLAKKRHDLVHGVVVSISKVNGVFPIEKLDYSAQGSVIREMHFDPASFPELADELIALGPDFPLFGRKLSDRFS